MEEIDVRDLITEKTRLVIDFDFVAFTAASAAEKVHIEVYVPGWEEKFTFKNRTEFKGRSKKEVGGWLGNLNEERVERNLPPIEVNDCLVTDVYVPEPIENCLYTAKAMVKSIADHLNITVDMVIGVMGEGQNHRHELPLPVQYKFQRKDVHKPIHLKATREYLSRRFSTVHATTDEADQLITQYQYAGFRDYKDTGFLSYITAVIDKDNAGSLGAWFNCNKNRGTGEWMYPEPFWVEGLGFLYRRDKKEKGDQLGDVKGFGFMWLMFQTVMGDYDTDGFSPTRPFGIKYGEVAAYNLLKDCKTATELIQAVMNQYLEWFPEMDAQPATEAIPAVKAVRKTKDREGVKAQKAIPAKPAQPSTRGVRYTSHCGKEMDVSAIEMADMIFQCAYMAKGPKDKTTFSSLCEKCGVKVC